MIIDFHTHITAPEIIERGDEHLVRDAWRRARCTTFTPLPPSSEDLL